MYFVYYEDDYPDNGGVGIEKFQTEEQVCEFIERRLNEDKDRQLDNYTIIKGEIIDIEQVEVAIKIRLKKYKPM